MSCSFPETLDHRVHHTPWPPMATKSFSYCVALTLTLLPPFTYKDPCHYIGHIQIIQHHLSFKSQVISNLNSALPCNRFWGLLGCGHFWWDLIPLTTEEMRNFSSLRKNKAPSPDKRAALCWRKCRGAQGTSSLLLTCVVLARVKGPHICQVLASLVFFDFSRCARHGARSLICFYLICFR